MKVSLDNLRQQYRNQQKIYLIVDNAAYQRSYEVQAHALKLGIEIKYLPPYSPNLNLIERVWKYFKKIVLRNKYFNTYSRFYDSIMNFFANFSNCKDDMQKLINHKFEIIKAG
jgi:transposase